jgi:hypothetical protein
MRRRDVRAATRRIDTIDRLVTTRIIERAPVGVNPQ